MDRPENIATEVHVARQERSPTRVCQPAGEVANYPSLVVGSVWLDDSCR